MKRDPNGPFIHLYFGDGKGKSTCAIGLCIRALGAGGRVALVQFDKGYDGEYEHYCERHVLRNLPDMELYPTGRERMLPDGTFRFGAEREDREEVERGLVIARDLLEKNEHSLVILDEVLTCYLTRMLRRKDLEDLVRIARHEFKGDLAMTGTAIPPGFEKLADLVTEMRCVKHYYKKGILARRGIDY